MTYDALNALDRAGINVNGKPSYTIDQAAVQLTREGRSWSTDLGQPTTVTYAFRATAPATMPADATGFRTFSYQQIKAAEYALSLWSQVANIKFVRVGTGNGFDQASYSDNATILFGNYLNGVNGADAFAILPGNRAASSATGDVWINGSYNENIYAQTTGESFTTMLHEIGHAIGLSHPSDYDAVDAGGDPTYAASAKYFEDSTEYSLMSYFDLKDTGGTTGSQSAMSPNGPLIDDIAAVQRLYGANTGTKTGDTVYGSDYPLVSGTDYAEPYLRSTPQYPIWGTVWDGGGTDTFDFHDALVSQKIDLRAGSFSNVYGGVGTLSIAAGVTIENAIGGNYGDTIIGNEVANVLRGGSGNDTLIGGGGNDLLDGGAGYDVAVIAASSASRLGIGNDLAVTVSSSDGYDTLVNMEAIQFTDRIYSIAGIKPVDALYTTYGGRHGTAAELLYWNDQMVSGASITTVRSAILADPLGQAYTPGAITNNYQTYFGRAPDSSEIAVWKGLIAGGADYNTLKVALVKEATGIAHTTAIVTDIYQNFFGRAPSASELGVWQNNIVAGADFGTVRAAVLADFSSQNYVVQTITRSYQDLAGRSPMPSEYRVWRGLFATTADIATMRSAIINDPANHFFSEQMNIYYQIYFGRNASAVEAGVWKDSLTKSGSLYDVASALLADPHRGVNAAADIMHLYQLHLGRDASGSEIGYWEDRIQAGATLDILRNALLSDSAAPAQETVNINALYQTYMQRPATASEIAFWKSTPTATQDYLSLTDRLLTLSTAPVVQHAVGTAGSDTFAFGSGQIALTIADFTPGVDKVAISNALYGGQDLLVHAVQFAPASLADYSSLPDTLVTLDATHAILFQHTSLSSLSTSDFLFT